MGVLAKDYPVQYFAASAFSAAINYPLWRASAISQSGFAISYSGVPSVLAPYVFAVRPPYKGALATVLGMTWARAAIFWGSDAGRDWMRSHNISESIATVIPPLAISTAVQIINQPVVRGTITIQNPASDIPNVWTACKYIYRHHGVAGLWHGTSAGILKTVPKYCTAVIVKDVMEEWLTPADPASPTYHQDELVRSAYKAIAAGVVGAAGTNPLDVIRNEMFKTNLSLTDTVKHLRKDIGWSFLWRGLGKNMVAVAIPVACTIFFTDVLIHFTKRESSDDIIINANTNNTAAAATAFEDATKSNDSRR